MPVIRTERATKYTPLSNETVLQNKALSWKARGFLAFLLSLPSDWEFSMSWLVEQSNEDGRASTEAARDELVGLGYIELRERREAGRFDSHEWIVRETPQIGQIQPLQENRSGKTAAENQQLQKNKVEENNNLTNISPICKNTASETVNQLNADFDEWWASVPKKEGKPAAKRAYLARRADGLSKDQLLNGIRAYANKCRVEKTEKSYIKHPQGWLNKEQERWAWDYTPSKTHGNGPKNGFRESHEVRADREKIEASRRCNARLPAVKLEDMFKNIAC